MEQFTDLVRTLGQMPVVYLAFFVIVGAFALAGFAIHAVLAVTKEKAK